MFYYLMRKDSVLGMLEIDSNGQMTKYSIDNFNNPELPLAHKCEPNYIISWWNDRCVPLSRGRVDEMLKSKGLLDNKKNLLNNLGLSLTDYYWIRPIDSNYKWKDVSLFINDFKDDIHIFHIRSSSTSSFTPNSSLQGDLEKTWLIKDNKRILVKGNHNNISQESINEVIATKFHELQGYDNYVKYELLKLKGTKYNYACTCDCFTSEDLEFVSAYDLLTSEKKKNDISEYEQLIKLAVKFGLKENVVRKQLEYQILSDYILSNKDRHMNNIGFLRDAKTLKFVSVAPIFDTGNSMFVDTYIPSNLDKLEINSFVKTEEKLLKYVRNDDLIDFNKLLDVETIKKYYLKDSNMDKENIEDICNAYVKKIELLKRKLIKK